ncbi:TPA_asm: integrase [Coelastrella green algae MELD virus]|nr:TPA_asm: integrase [Coelastrella green algae MELD virus]
MTDQETLLSLLDAQPRLKYLGKSKLLQELKGHGISKAAVDKYFESSALHQVFAAPVKRPARLQYMITGQPRSFQIDILAGLGFAKKNKGFQYALLAVDILSRKAWAYPLKTRNMTEVITAYSKFVKDQGVNVKQVQHTINMINTDDEFGAKAFQQYNQELGIKVYSNVAAHDHQQSGDFLGIIDRLCGTLKRQLQLRYVTHPGEEGLWTKWLPRVVQDYNATLHSTLGITPNDAYDRSMDEQYQMYAAQKAANQALDAKAPKFQIGDSVRVLLNRSTFQKDGARWSDALHTVTERLGYKYLVSGTNRRYKANEMQLVKSEAITKVDTAPLKAAVKRETARKKITSKQEGISVHEDALIGKETPREHREKAEKRSLRELHLKVGEFIVLDAEGASDEGIRLSVSNPRRRRSYGYVWAGFLVKKVRGRMYVRFLQSAHPRHRDIADPLTLTEDSQSVPDSVHADALLYRSTDIVQSESVKLPAAAVESIQQEYQFVDTPSSSRNA